MRNSASSIISTPSSSAFAAFEPAFSPTTTNVVFFETLEATFALLQVYRIGRKVPMHNVPAVQVKVESFLAN